MGGFDAAPQNPVTTTTTPIPGVYASDCMPCAVPMRGEALCRETAAKLNVYYNEEAFNNDENYPEGCFKLDKTLWYNKYDHTTATHIRRRRNARKSDGTRHPMCDGSDYTGYDHASQSFKSLNGTMKCICQGTAPALSPTEKTSGTCGTQRPLKSCECTTLAQQLGLEFTQFNASMVSYSHPARCFLDSTSKLWWNSALDSQVQCGSGGTTCICAA